MKRKNKIGGKKREEKTTKGQQISICTNKDCKLRKAGCKGFEACPGYKGR